MKFKPDRLQLFFCGLNLLFSILIIAAILLNFQTGFMVSIAILLIILNLFLMVREIIIKPKSGVVISDNYPGTEETLDKSSILSDIDLELDRRRAAKKFERN